MARSVHLTQLLAARQGHRVEANLLKQKAVNQEVLETGKEKAEYNFSLTLCAAIPVVGPSY